jgi:alkanesulfonate monooxygenase SsuD/methylene tetrahydromethanopterin reductase-like flavin-dependent oxidoreductase (luciferase family)
MVTGVTYRHPGLLVKTVTTLDVLSGGRAYLGMAAIGIDEAIFSMPNVADPDAFAPWSEVVVRQVALITPAGR